MEHSLRSQTQSLQPPQLIRVLQGVGVATKAPADILNQVELWILQTASDENGRRSHDDDARQSSCQSPALDLEFWRSALSIRPRGCDDDSGFAALAGLAVATCSLQQASRNSLRLMDAELSIIWDTICDALTCPALQSSWSPSRSAQGFLAVPLCSITKEGKIDQLFRFHVWLPDSYRGNPDFAIHSHQPYAQSWVLAGEGTDRQYRVNRVNHASAATHAEFNLRWSDGKNLSKKYSTHQHSSVVANSGTLVRAEEILHSIHGRHASYTIPAGVFHRTEVSPNALHATIFYFDSHRGFFQDAPVLGPVDGDSSTQVRNPAGYTPGFLAGMVKVVRSWEDFIEEGGKHSRNAAWEHAQRAFNSALSVIGGAKDLINTGRYRGLTLGELGKTNRRFGRYAMSEQLLKEACSELLGSGPEQVALIGELGVVYRQMNRFSEAKESFEMQYNMAKSLRLDLEICRAVGNLGTVNYQLWEASSDVETLQLAIQQLQERVDRCEGIQASIGGGTDGHVPSASQLRRQAEVWAAVALARLSLCFCASGRKEDSLNAAMTGLQHARRTGDPTVVAISHFFCGRALSLNGKKDEALCSFNASEGCTPPIAFCKEPSEEHYRYLEYMVDAGADMDIMDSDGYKALDYAVFNGDKASADLVLKGLRHQFNGQVNVESMLIRWQKEASRRKGYRELFQEKLRPVLLAGGRDCTEKLREAYADALSADQERSEFFDSLKTIPYPKFATFGRLPRSSDGMAESWTTDGRDGCRRKQFVIFFSYRWMNPVEGAVAGGMADDANHTQYRRMRRGAEDLLQNHPELTADDLHIWMVSTPQDASAPTWKANLAIFLHQGLCLC
jgi:tetratricopeptide (TPR) repeat protein